VIKPSDLGLHFPPAAKAHQRDLRISKHDKWLQFEHKVTISDLRVKEENDGVTAELLVQWNTEKDADLQREWTEVSSFIPLNTSFNHRFDTLYGLISQRFGNADEKRTGITQPEDLITRRLYREGIRDRGTGETPRCKSEVKNRRAIVVEARREGSKLFYTWINRKGQYARHVEYRPGCLEMMTRATMEKRLELRRDDPDAMSLNTIGVNGGKKLLGERLLTLLSQPTTKRKLVVCELFKGQGSLSKMIADLGLQDHVTIVSVDLDAKYRADITDDILNWRSWITKRFAPGYFDIIWASPPCTDYSAAKTTGVRDIEGANAIVTATKEFIRYMRPKVFFLENPASGKHALHRQMFMKDWARLRHEVTY
jgi:hypothetical protein